MSYNVINPYQVFYDSTGKVRAAGKITFYLNTTTTLASIFSDEALTVAQSNPYTLDAFGRIVGDVKYKGLLTLKIQNSDDSDVLTLDNVAASKGLILFDNAGNEVIVTAGVSSAVNEITVTNAATGNAPVVSTTGGDTNIGLTLTPKGTGGTTITTGDLTLADGILNTAEGANIASASDCNIWANGDGNTVHLTGTATVADWGTAPQAGSYMWVIVDGAVPLTYNSATNDLTGAADYTCEAKDLLFVYARSTSSYKVTIFPYDGFSPVKALVSGTVIATTTGSSKNFTGIPSWVKRITLMFNTVSVSGTSELLVQLGDSGGIEDSGYVSTAIRLDGGANSLATSTSGFILNSDVSATESFSGSVVLTLEDSANFIWTGTGNLAFSSRVLVSAGRKDLTATLTQVRLTTAGGTEAFDLGSANILYE